MRTLLLVSAALGLACGDNGLTTPTDPMAAVAGSWTIQAWEFRDAGNPAKKRDMVAGGFAGTLVVGPAGAFTVSLTFQNQPTSSVTGTLTIRGDTLVLNTQDGEVLIKYTSVGGVMTWDTLQPEVADIDGDGVPEDMVEHIVFRRP